MVREEDDICFVEVVEVVTLCSKNTKHSNMPVLLSGCCGSTRPIMSHCMPVQCSRCPYLGLTLKICWLSPKSCQKLATFVRSDPVIKTTERCGTLKEGAHLCNTTESRLCISPPSDTTIKVPSTIKEKH